jgi:Ser-tRNA(Ala) deacylase AlaX
MDLTAVPPTEKLYLQDTYLFTCQSTVFAIEEAREGFVAVVLAKTVFHPQGGGQPSDVGTLTAEGFSFEVSSVKQVMSFENWYSQYIHLSYCRTISIRRSLFLIVI